MYVLTQTSAMRMYNTCIYCSTPVRMTPPPLDGYVGSSRTHDTRQNIESFSTGWTPPHIWHFHEKFSFSAFPRGVGPRNGLPKNKNAARPWCNIHVHCLHRYCTFSNFISNLSLKCLSCKHMYIYTCMSKSTRKLRICKIDCIMIICI